MAAPGISLKQLFDGLEREQLLDLLEIIHPDFHGIYEILKTDISLAEIAERIIDPMEIIGDGKIRDSVVKLLPRTKAEELASRLGIGESVGTLRTELSEHNYTKKSRGILCSFLGISEPEQAAHAILEREKPINAHYGIYEHQRHTVRAVCQLLCQNNRKVLLHMPTGAGKTRTAMHIIARHLIERDPTVVCWLAQGRELLEQAAEQFDVAWSHLGNRELQLQRFWGSSDADPLSMRDGLIVAGLKKIHEFSEKRPGAIQHLGDRASLTIIDEAHQSIATTYAGLLTAIHSKKPRNALLGLTATPGRSWDDIDEDQRLSNFFDQVKVGLQVPDDKNAVEYLVDEGYLSRACYRVINVDATMTMSAAERNELEAGVDFPGWLLDRLGQNQARSMQIVREVEFLLAKHDRIIVFAPSVRGARMIDTILSAKGYSSLLVTATTHPARRRSTISKFLRKSAKKIVLCNFGVLTTGFDAPLTTAVVIARPTKSLVLYSQMVGRALRGPRAGGTSEAEVVTVSDTSLAGFGDVGEAFYNWEDVWKPR